MSARPFYFAAHAEMQDASRRSMDANLAPASATIELAKLLARFEIQIDDEWRAAIIHIGGGLIQLDRQHDFSKAPA